MPTLLEDFASETAVSSRRMAERLEAEVEEISHDAIRARRYGLMEVEHVTALVITDAARAKLMWQSTLELLREEALSQLSCDTKPMLRSLITIFEAGERMARSGLALWNFLNETIEHSEGLETLRKLQEAKQAFEKLSSEGRLALDHREKPWQPNDPDRLAEGLRLALEGKTVKADEARSRFR